MKQKNPNLKMISNMKKSLKKLEKAIKKFKKQITEFYDDLSWIEENDVFDTSFDPEQLEKHSEEDSEYLVDITMICVDDYEVLEPRVNNKGIWLKASSYTSKTRHYQYLCRDLEAKDHLIEVLKEYDDYLDYNYDGKITYQVIDLSSAKDANNLDTLGPAFITVYN